VTKELEAWSSSSGLPINTKPGKTELLNFTGGEVIAKINGATVRNVTNYTYLGVNVDQKLTFRQHADKLAAAMEENLQVLRRKQWCTRTQHLRVLYLAYAYTKLTYALGAWWPTSSQDTRNRLVKLHKEAALVISGCTTQARLGVRYREAGLDDLERKAEEAAGVTCAKIRWLCDLKTTGEEKGQTWKTMGHRVLAKYDLLELMPETEEQRMPPWEQIHYYNVSARHTLLRPIKKTDAPEERRRAAQETLEALPEADITCYTDGSVRHPERVKYGTGAYIIRDRGGAVYEGVVPTGARSTPYNAERAALDAAVQRIRDEIQVPHGAEIRILTDCQALVRVLGTGPAGNMSAVEEELVLKMAKLCRSKDAHVTLQWIPSHCGLEDNDRVDEMAKVTPVSQTKQVGLQVMKQAIKLEVRREWDKETDLRKGGIHKDHVWTLATGGRVPRFPVDPALPRREQRLLAQLRSGKSAVLGAYKAVWTRGAAAEANCAECGEVDDIQHFLRCPFKAAQRKVAFGTETPAMDVLHKQQRAVVQYAGAIGIWRPRNGRAVRQQVAVALCCCAAATAAGTRTTARAASPKP
jgi:ribonuclease HI